MDLYGLCRPRREQQPSAPDHHVIRGILFSPLSIYTSKHHSKKGVLIYIFFFYIKRGWSVNKYT